MIDFHDVRVQSDRDGSMVIECMACWREADVHAPTVAELIEWAARHACPPAAVREARP